MKICHLIYDDLGNPWLSGGGAVRAREIYRRLAERHQITLITGRYPGARSEERKEGMRFVRVGPAQKEASQGGYARSRLAYCRRAVAALQAEEYDLWVHEFSAFAPLWAPWPVRRRGLLLFQHFVGRHALKKNPMIGGFAWAAEIWTLRAYQRIVAVSPSVQARIRKAVGGRAVQIDCVYNGVDARFFALEPEEAPYILYFGRADLHAKGIDVLLDAFARIAPDYPELALKMAGRGSPHQLARVDRLVQRHHLAARVEAVGEVDEVGQEELLRRALFVCMPSRYEGWGMVAVEAAAAGKAVLGTRISGLKDAVRHGETGLLVEAGREEALAQGMRCLLDDDSKRWRLGVQARQWALRFDWDRIAREQEEVYLRVARENRPQA